MSIFRSSEFWALNAEFLAKYVLYELNVQIKYILKIYTYIDIYCTYIDIYIYLYIYIYIYIISINLPAYPQHLRANRLMFVFHISSFLANETLLRLAASKVWLSHFLISADF